MAQKVLPGNCTKNREEMAACPSYSSWELRDQACIWHPFTQAQTARPPIPIVKGKGAHLYAETGEVYLDAISSWWVNLHGHGHPYIAEKITSQANQLEHVLFAGFTHPQAIILAERLLSLFCGIKQVATNGASEAKPDRSEAFRTTSDHSRRRERGERIDMIKPQQAVCHSFTTLVNKYSRVFYSDNGSTAVEIALKMALQSKGDGKQVLSFHGAYHGDTFGAMSAAGKTDYNCPFWPYLFKVHSITPPLPGKEEESWEACKAALQSNNIAAFIFEPLIQGAGGMRLYSKEILTQMIRACQAKGIVTIADEVMTGFGRTGPLFACSKLDATPDLLCLSKGITGGFLPLAVTIVKEDLFESFLSSDPRKAFLHGHSYTANPIACAAANANLDLLLQPECADARARIESEHRQFQAKWKNHPKLIRCDVLGTILAIEYNVEKASYHHPLKTQLFDFFLENKILVRPLGNVLYLLPPYCITSEDLHKIYSAIQVTLEDW